MAAHLQPEEAYRTVSLAARRAIGLPTAADLVVGSGDPSEFLAIRASTVREAVATASADRVVVHRGEVVARTRTQREV
jgi:cytosine deaminase